MSKVILICGKMCSGKTTYAKSLIKKNPVVLLSCDELTTLFFGSDGGAEHYVEASNDVLLENLNKRNREIEAGQQTSSYYFPEEIARSFWDEMFELPAKSEMDIWYVNRTV